MTEIIKQNFKLQQKLLYGITVNVIICLMLSDSQSPLQLIIAFHRKLCYCYHLELIFANCYHFLSSAAIKLSFFVLHVSKFNYKFKAKNLVFEGPKFPVVNTCSSHPPCGLGNTASSSKRTIWSEKFPHSSSSMTEKFN